MKTEGLRVIPVFVHRTVIHPDVMVSLKGLDINSEVFH